MHARRMLRLFTALSIMLLVSSALVFAGGKQEKANEAEKESEQETTQQVAPEQNEKASENTGQTATAEEGNNEPVAEVNGEEISRQEYDQLLNYFRYQYMQQGMQVQGSQLEELKKMVLESMIDNVLMYQIAKENGYAPSEEELDEELRKTKERFDNTEAYQQALNQQGMSEADLRDELAVQMTKYKFEQDKFGAETKVEPSEVKEFYENNPEQFEQPEQVRASHILIKVPEDATEEDKQAAREKLMDAKERIENGEEFSEVAREVSEGPSNERGGDLDYFGRGQMVPEFEEAVFNMEVGQLSDIVKTSFGYHLIKKTDAKEAADVPFEEVQQDIKTHLERVKLQEAKKDFLEDRRQDADIQRFEVSD